MQALKLVVVMLLAAVIAQAQEASTGCRKTLKVDEFLIADDAVAAKRALRDLRNALLSGDRQQTIALIEFPADLKIGEYFVKFKSARELEPHYKELFTDYVVESVRAQKPEDLVAGWDGVSLTNEAIRFQRQGNGQYRIENVAPYFDPPPDSITEFKEKRLTCLPIVVEGRIVAYNWVSHSFVGPENIYADHFIVDVSDVVAGKMKQKRIRVDFWGVSHLPDYNLPTKAFEPGTVWRMYLRPAADPPFNEGVCGPEVQETISNVNEAGREFSEESAIKILEGAETPTYDGLPCYEVKRQLFFAREQTPSTR